MGQEDEESRTRVVEGVVELLEHQLDRAEIKSNKEAKKRLASIFALGYIYGFSMAANAAMEIEQQQYQILALTRIYDKIFGKTVGPTRLKETHAWLEFSEFQEARDKGGKEFEAALASGVEAEGLADYLLSGGQAPEGKV